MAHRRGEECVRRGAVCVRCGHCTDDGQVVGERQRQHVGVERVGEVEAAVGPHVHHRHRAESGLLHHSRHARSLCRDGFDWGQIIITFFIV